MKGFSIVEVVIGAAIVALVVTGIASAWQFYLKLAGQSTRTAQAAILIEEGAEILQYLRDKSWDSNIGVLSTNTPYYLHWTGTDYLATTTQYLINGSFARTATFSSVSRDASANISQSGTQDPGTMTATLRVYPAGSSTATILEAQMLIHDVFSN